MTHRARVEAVLAGRRPDHPPVCFWHHFPPHQATGTPAVEAHLRFLETYDLDFLKVMNDHFYPRGEVDVLRSVEDLRKIRPLPGDAGGFSGQLEVLRGLRQRLGPDMLMSTTLFNAWTVLRRFTAPPSDRHGPPRLDGMDERDDTLSRLLKEDRSAFKAALDAVSDTLAAFAAACLEAGADGVFLSVRDDWVDRPENGAGVYEEMVRPTDLKILAAVARGRFNVLHACGRPQNLGAFAEYPVQAINWADRAAGPSIAWACDHFKPARSASEGPTPAVAAGPSIASACDHFKPARSASEGPTPAVAAGPSIASACDHFKPARSASEGLTPAIAAGVDNLNTLPKGTPEDCANEVRDALRQAGDRPIIIAAGCTFDPNEVPAENLRAVVAAARDA